MKPGSEETGHGEDEADAAGHIYEEVFNRGAMRGVHGSTAVAGGLCMSEMRTHSRIPAVQWIVPVRTVPAADFGDSGHCAPREPCAPDQVVSGFLLGVL